MRILTVTNLYPTERDPTFGTFVGDQVAALTADPRVEWCRVLFIDGRKHTSNYARAVVQVNRAVRSVRPDVVSAHHGLAGAVAVLQRAVPVVVTYHTGDLEQARWQRTISRMAYRLAASNICVSQHAMRELPGPAHHVTCSIDLALFRPVERVAAREAFQIAPGELALLFPSSPDRKKKAYPRFAEVCGLLRRRETKFLHLWPLLTSWS
jgi:hypothetical protein